MSGNLNLALTLQLKDQLIGPLQRAVADAEKSMGGLKNALGQLGTTSDQSGQKLTNLAGKADALGRVHGAAKLKSDLAGVGAAADDAQRQTGRLAAMMERLPSLAAKASTAFIGLAAAQRMIAGPVNAFANLEDANTALRVTMMTKGGKVSNNYGAIQKIAVGLGNQLPGTTRDFIGAANELLSLGVSENAVVNGGLTAAAHLGVVMKMPPQQSAETVAKMREAYSLKDEELPGMADEIQRNRFAFGMRPSDMLLAAKYSAPTLNTLGLSGKNNMSEIMTLQGMANLKGMDGSQFGTNFDMMLQRLAKGPLMIEEAKKGMKAEARDLMNRAGINFDFYDKKGALKTEDGSAVKGMLRELEKLELIRKKLGDKAAMEVSGAVFGQEAARPAQILAQYGVKGFETARERVSNQASLEDRTAESLTTLNSKIEAVTGSFENLNANMAKQLGESAKPRLEKINALLGDATDFAAEHPAAGTATILGTAAAFGLGAWKASGALWNKLTSNGVAPAAASGAAESTAAVAAGGGVMSVLQLLGRVIAGPLMLLEALGGPSDEDIEKLRARDRREKAERDKAEPSEVTATNAQQQSAILAQALAAFAQRPIILTIDGREIATSTDSFNDRSARRN